MTLDLSLAGKRYTVLVADRSTGVVRRFTIALRPALTVVTTVLALPVLIGLGARWSARVEIADLKTNNVALVMENESYRAATGQLASQVSSLQSAITELSEQAAVDPAVQRAMEKLPALGRASAMGGGTPGATSARAVLSTTLSSPENTFGMLRDLLGVLENRLQTVRYGVERRQALAAATPSIWPATGWLSSTFGDRPDPFNGEQNFHPGIDISADRGTPVHAPADGSVESASYSGNYGNLIVLDHGFGIQTRFGHLSRFATRAGQTVKRGDLIGYVGSTGRSTSPHLHYEVTLNGRLINPLRLLTERRQ
jgi:murein DD-endopeptidase MepM/ murein hydrolase activator NlpD